MMQERCIAIMLLWPPDATVAQLAVFCAVQALGLSEKICRTNSIEVGMQNSALGAVLATLHFAADPTVAAPCAISACTHATLGSLLAGYWRARPVDDMAK